MTAAERMSIVTTPSPATRPVYVIYAYKGPGKHRAVNEQSIGAWREGPAQNVPAGTYTA
jgi:hypothetical protein